MVAPELIVANQIINFQPPNRLLRALIGQPEATAPRSPHTVMGPKSTFFSNIEFTSKFIEINGNPFILYVIDCTRTYYDTQNNETIKITYKISTFFLPHHQPLKICFSCSLIEIHQILCIHFIKHSLDESRQQPVMKTLHRFN